jgi:pyruvate kinase
MPPTSDESSALQASTMTGARFTTIPQAAAVATPPKLAQRWRKSTKQVATLGPASSNMAMIEKLFLAGADVFRLNFSHGSQEQKLDLLNIIRSVEEKYSHPIAILGDLQGPKLRVRFYEKLFVCLLLLAW